MNADKTKERQERQKRDKKVCLVGVRRRLLQLSHSPRWFAVSARLTRVERFLIRNFGCRATQADGAAIEASLVQCGLRPVSLSRDADLVVLNTCTVTSAADEDARRAVRRMHRENPAARILVTGCYAQRAPEELAGLPGVTWVVGNSHKGQIAEIVSEAQESTYHAQIRVGDIYAEREFLSASIEGAGGERSRPNLKIQDGCNNRCSFCIIPSVRGPSRSARVEWVIGEVRRLSGKYPEIVLSGINLGRWGREAGGAMRLKDLLRRLLDETEIARLRLSSVEPMDFTEDLLALMAGSARIARHVHAPLQSGSDAVLRRMRRKYRARHYEDRIRRARQLMPQAAIGADVMAGFPGETEAEFEESRQFIESLPFTYLHVFTYSERPGTPAAAMPQVPIAERRRRCHVLRELSAEKNLEFRRSMIGRTLSVVTLDEGRAALSDNYLQVALARARPARRLLDVRIDGLTDDGLRELNPLAVVV